jgi:signal transduction histidine kinase
MHVSTALAKFLPTDPGYTPFGWPLLRGLNVLHFALIGGIGVLWGTGDGLGGLAWGDDASLADFAGRVRFRTGQALIVFMAMLLLVTAGDNLGAASTPARRIALLAAATALGAAIAALLGSPAACLQRWDFSAEFCAVDALGWSRVGHFGRALMWGTLYAALLYFYKRERDTAQALHRTQMQRLATERQETEARLSSLQAQIEPHFLFNTLAHIQRLYQVQPATGRAMLRNLSDYLRSALPHMRRPQSTLGRELALARAYLSVQQIRMGERLRVEVEVADALADSSLPPMMLVTLVENAIKHGLSPKPEGGTVRIFARRAEGRLEVEVSDDGVGLAIGAGTGRGLSNTRARLATMFGTRGSLDVGNRERGGVSALLALPLTQGIAT